MRDRRHKSPIGRCDHRKTITIRATGLERIVCEHCGHVSFIFVSDMTGDIDRDRFAREVDLLQQV